MEAYKQTCDGNFLKKSENMVEWKDMVVVCDSETIYRDTVYDLLDRLGRVPERPVSAPVHMLTLGIYGIKRAGEVLAGRVAQRQGKSGEEVVFSPTHTVTNPLRYFPWRCITSAWTSPTSATTSA
jgi:elongation factor 1-alpha